MVSQNSDFLNIQLPGGLEAEDFFGADPRLAFFGQQDRFGKSQNQRQSFESRFPSIFNRYLGNLGQQLGQGNVPSQTFNEFLGGFDFDEEFRSLAPSTAGRNTNRFAPSARLVTF